jgi:RES domain-containing protein
LVGLNTASIRDAGSLAHAKREAHVATAFSGEGAAKSGGRWNSRGVVMVYTSGSKALAALENLVHLNPLVSFKYVAIHIEFDNALIEKVSALPADWRVEPPPPFTKQIGDAWVRAGRSAILPVPSVIIPSEFNYLLNAAHPKINQLKWKRTNDSPNQFHSSALQDHRGFHDRRLPLHLFRRGFNEPGATDSGATPRSTPR